MAVIAQLTILRMKRGKISENQISVGGRGFEPLTSSMSTKRANQLRQPPRVGVDGFEPSAPAL
jgi:hypothetical protein